MGWGILIILSTALTITVGFLCWTANTVYTLNAELAVVRTQQIVNTQAIKDIQDKGSPIIQAVMVRLDTLQAGQVRIEKALDEHMNKKP